MSFLAPLFILGALAVAAPIIFHLIRRTSKEKISFSSLMFLQPTPPRVTKKSRLENILLLILRCTVLCLLALAFGRPFLRNPLNAGSSSGVVTRTILLVDTSASMRRENLSAEAVERAIDFTRRAAPAEQVAIYTFDRNARAVMPFTEWNKASLSERRVLAEQRLRAVKPTWNNTHLGNALVAASEAFDAEREHATAERRVMIISDMQEGAHLEGLQGFPWPKQTHVSMAPIKPKKPANAGVQLLSAVGGNTTQTNESVRVRINNSMESGREQFELRWAGTISNATAIYVPPGQGRMLDLPRALGSDSLTLTGDDAEFDNHLFIITPPREQIEVTFIGHDHETNTQQLLFYLKRAFPETARQQVHITLVRPDEGFSAAMRNATLVVLAAPLPDHAQRELGTALTNGMTVLCVARSPEESQAVAGISGQSVTAEEAAPSGYRMLAEIEFAHPLFAPFADARFSDFTKIHFWKHRRLNFGSTNTHILARFDNGDPAVAQINVGKGTLFVLAAGWQPGDSQLALSSKFVPLLYSLLEIGGALKAQSLAFAVGDPVDLSSLRATNALTIRKPDGTTASVRADVKSFGETDMPGVYSVVGVEPPLRFAVNLAPEESKTAPLATEQLEQLGVPIRVQPVATAKQVARREAQLKAVELESNQKLWRWLIAATLVVLIIETWVAARISRRATPATA
ncbi:MAG TPA: BatA domain-containing protein [Methylomirabilota bacterium]|nr:BatA domain-containing protein [Methylomirabilota bacterium]